ncbi:MAG: 50S ribosomal protein L35 [Patescibacteria group bacterium]|nr:50S ribosomal protein L35 [Patescibacteria group bacterium]
MKKNKKVKIKTKKSAAKRFKITSTGKITFRGSHVRHLRRKKKKSNLRSQKLAKSLKGRWKMKAKKMLAK